MQPNNAFEQPGSRQVTACFVGGLLGGVLLAVPLALGFTITIIVKWKNMAEHNEPTPPTGGT